MIEKSEYELIISEGRISFWKNVVASFGFTMVIFSGFYMAMRLWENEITENLIKSCGGFMMIIGFGLALLIHFASTSVFLIDADTQTLVTRHHIGPLTFSSSKKMPMMQCLLILKSKYDSFYVNLLYNHNKILTLSSFDNKEDALTFAKEAATKLSLELLNSPIK